MADTDAPVCPQCEGTKEVSHGSCGIPECEHFDECPTCGGSGTMPTVDDIAEIRLKLHEVQGDLVATEYEVAQYKERCAETDPRKIVDILLAANPCCNCCSGDYSYEELVLKVLAKMPDDVLRPDDWKATLFEGSRLGIKSEADLERVVADFRRIYGG